MRKALVLCALLGVVLPGRAEAEWHFTPSMGVTFAKGTNFTDLWGFSERRDRTFGMTVSRLGEGILGFEGVVGLTPNFFEIEVPDGRQLDEATRVVTLMGNVVLTTPRLWTEYSLRPFVSGGLGLLHARGQSDPFFPFAADFGGFNLGAGAIGFLSDRTGIRFEMRYFGNLRNKEVSAELTEDGRPAHLRYMTASIGVVIRTGVR
jgi:hypothetical protein